MDVKNQLNNFIPINRKLFKHEFWEEKRAYSRFEAWLDLVATARFTDTETHMLVGNKLVAWGRGELVASLRYLATRWGWGKNKVSNYIKLLSDEQMIKTRTADGTVQTVITICNYDIYNAKISTPGQPPGQLRDSSGTVTGQQRDKTNKENKEEKSKERNIYRGFAHLVLFDDEFFKLTAAGFNKTQVDEILDDIENFKNNKKYTSLYLTAKKWLQKTSIGDASPATAGATMPQKGRVVQIANAFQLALKHG